ncbi:hypothetical protein E2C01_084061 [Portunus trituberculatus]|uniref:Uncharacterized protein n=1 Tax=Portunus trituberculatus TaxID=210409 RepID=A0A5B7J868_PORTR|nr:hypothetical protein [Portunus trituberculatus]
MSEAHGGVGTRSHARSASHGGIMLTRDAGKADIHSLIHLPTNQSTDQPRPLSLIHSPTHPPRPCLLAHAPTYHALTHLRTTPSFTHAPRHHALTHQPTDHALTHPPIIYHVLTHPLTHQPRPHPPIEHALTHPPNTSSSTHPARPPNSRWCEGVMSSVLVTFLLLVLPPRTTPTVP